MPCHLIGRLRIKAWADLSTTKTYSVGSFLFMTSMHEKELKLQATKKRVDFKANEKRNEQEKKRPATLQSKSEVQWDEAVYEAP